MFSSPGLLSIWSSVKRKHDYNIHRVRLVLVDTLYVKIDLTLLLGHLKVKVLRRLEVIKLVVVDKYTFADDEYSDEDIPEYQHKAWEYEDKFDRYVAK